MPLLAHLFGLDRNRWFICYNCMGLSNHDETKSIFYSRAPKVVILGRAWQKCPRCASTNTRAFAELKDAGEDSALWGLERTAKKFPRKQFEFNESKS